MEEDNNHTIKSEVINIKEQINDNLPIVVEKNPYILIGIGFLIFLILR